MKDRTAWTSHVRSELDRLQLEWCYWDLTGDFGVHDPQTATMRTPLLQAERAEMAAELVRRDEATKSK